MLDQLLVYGAYAAMAAAFGIATYAIGTNPPPPTPRLGTRGYRRHRALAENRVFALIEPTMRFVAGLIAHLPLAEARDSADKELIAAGDYLGLSADEYFALSVMCAAGGLALGLMAGGESALLPIAGLGIGFILPRHRVAARAALRRKQIQRGLPLAIDLAALCLGAGLDFPGAIRQVTETAHDEDDALQEELRAILRELELGHTRRQALEAFAARVGIDTVSDFVSAVVQSEERGNPLAEVLRIQAEVLRQRRSVKGEEAAARASVLMIAPLVMLILSVMVIIVAPLLLRSMAAFEGG